jgi:hypothetical protein
VSALRHIWRAELPWRRTIETECGLRVRSAIDGRATSPVAERCVNRASYLDEQRRECREPATRHRWLLGFCQPCQLASLAHRSFDESPHLLLLRACQVYGKRARLIDSELRAVALLVARHRDEFDEQIEAELVLDTLLEMR